MISLTCSSKMLTTLILSFIWVKWNNAQLTLQLQQNSLLELLFLPCLSTWNVTAHSLIHLPMIQHIVQEPNNNLSPELNVLSLLCTPCNHQTPILDILVSQQPKFTSFYVWPSIHCILKNQMTLQPATKKFLTKEFMLLQKPPPSSRALIQTENVLFVVKPATLLMHVLFFKNFHFLKLYVQELALLWNRLYKIVNWHNCQQAIQAATNRTPTATSTPATASINSLATQSFTSDNDESSIQADSSTTFNDDSSLDTSLGSMDF